jgi:hypothetical protein
MKPPAAPGVHVDINVPLAVLISRNRPALNTLAYRALSHPHHFGGFRHIVTLSAGRSCDVLPFVSIPLA